MYARIIIILLVFAWYSSSLPARLIDPWTYQELYDKADLVVVARFDKSQVTDEHTVLLDGIKVVGVLSEFEAKLILKGDKSITKFRLHHFQLTSGDDWRIADGPSLITFKGPHPEFLLFLTQESDHTYRPTSGQTDPAGVSVLELTTY